MEWFRGRVSKISMMARLLGNLSPREAFKLGSLLRGRSGRRRRIRFVLHRREECYRRVISCSAIDRPLSVIRLSKERNWERIGEGDRGREREGNDELAS